MSNFWDFNVWGTFNIFAVLFASLLIGNMLQKGIPFLRNSLTPTSVIGGVILIIIAAVYKAITGNVMWDTAFFGGKGTEVLEIITYHTLALGFITSTLKSNDSKVTKQRAGEVFNTGLTTVAMYLIQGIVGLGITMIVAKVIPGFFKAAGIILPFGYGQGTGQALNYGNIYETEFGFVGGKSFGLTIAALGFLSASIGGVIYLNLMKHRGRLKLADKSQFPKPASESVDGENEIPLNESLDKLTVQVSLIAVAYFLTYLLMFLLGTLVPGLQSIVYGFNFLIGVMAAIIVKSVLKFFRRKNIVKKEYLNNFLLTRTGNFFFDIMIVSGIAAIRLDILEQYWGVIAILAVAGTIVTFIYTRVTAKVLFPHYAEEQFLMMYGMLTGTASTGIILLREVDGEFRTPASDNMVYQNLPAIAFGFPMMLLATLAPEKPVLTMVILIAYCVALNIILFRKQIFRKKKDKIQSDVE
ncbi:MAG: hypothetical protein MJ192_11155 [Clostridia bacterium]|nr:hypothetical protein [Clostridia bacterium]